MARMARVNLKWGERPEARGTGQKWLAGINAKAQRREDAQQISGMETTEAQRQPDELSAFKLWAPDAGQKEAPTGMVRQPAGSEPRLVFDRAGHQRCHYDIHHGRL